MKSTPILDKAFLQMLVCPETGEVLELEDNALVCESNVYRIKDGVPIMIPNKDSICD